MELCSCLGSRSKSELRLHEFRQFRIGLLVRISPDDSGLLGKLVPGEIFNKKVIFNFL
jgi:hypothetical protein